MSRRKALSMLLYAWLIITPVLAGYVVSASQGISRDVAYTYTQDAIVGVKSTMYNSSSSSYLAEISQDWVFDNDTFDAAVVSMNFTSGTNITEIGLYYNYNVSALNLTSDVYKIVVSWSYVGVGNLTYLLVVMDSDTVNVYGTGVTDLYESTSDIAENGTVIDVLETFQSLKLPTQLGFRVLFRFTDENNLPAVGDYFTVNVQFYRKDMLISRATLLQYVIGGFGVLNFIFAIAMTGYWNPLGSKSPHKGKYWYEKKKFDRRYYKKYGKHRRR